MTATNELPRMTTMTVDAGDRRAPAIETVGLTHPGQALVMLG